MKTLTVMFIMALSVMIISESLAAPFLEIVDTFNGYNNVYRRVKTTRRRLQTEKPRTAKPRGRSFKEICRAINPAPHAFPNKIPYPSVPIC